MSALAMLTLYPIWIGNQRYAVPQSMIVGIDHIAWLGSPTSHVHTKRGAVRLAYVHERFAQPTPERDTLTIVLVNGVAGLVGIVVDQLDDALGYAQPLLPLPAMIPAASSNVVLGVALIDDEPCLVLDFPALVAHEQSPTTA